jgi:UDP-N-acetylmuramate--alanine ligase
MKFYGKLKRAHFVGIGGSGMSGIAELCLAHGLKVTGSDLKESGAVEHLRQKGAQVAVGHSAAEVEGADVVVFSGAVRGDNPALLRARELGLPVVARAEMLAELMRLTYAILVAGSHGKTTVTSMIADVLTRGGADPTVVIGGRLGRMGSGARLGASQLTVAEADESDGSFLMMRPTVCVITNIDREHLDHYGSFEKLLAAYVDFANQVPFFGRIIVCGDDPAARSILPSLRRPVTTFGEGPDNEVRIEGISLEGLNSRFTLLNGGGAKQPVTLTVPGRHNVLNGAAALIAAAEVGLGWGAAAPLIADFHNADRRFDLKGEAGGVTVYDDYGHHPTEIKATLAAARAAFPNRRLVVAFEPHRYSRTELLFSEFTTAFQDCDVLYITEIYPAGETARPVSGQALAAAIAAKGPAAQFVPAAADLPARLKKDCRPGDVVFTLGAGTITQAGPRLLQLLEGRAS